MALFCRLPARRAAEAFWVDQAVRRDGCQTVGQVIDRLERRGVHPDRTARAINAAVYRLRILEFRGEDLDARKVGFGPVAWFPEQRAVAIRPLDVDAERLGDRRVRRMAVAA